MYKSSIIAAVMATMATADYSNPPTWVWSVTDFTGGCSPAACTFDFNITAPDYESYFKGFSASCSGNTLQNNDNYVVCDQPDSDKVISAKIGQFVESEGQQKIQAYVSYDFRSQILPNVQVAYNFTGIGYGLYEGRTNPGFKDNFTMSPSDVTFEKIV